jgi:hypothetical protein
MLSDSEIIRIVINLVSYYPGWTIGLTDDPERSRAEHSNPATWYDWDTFIEPAAKNVEKYFLAKGMQSAPTSGKYPTYVYIFK